MDPFSGSAALALVGGGLSAGGGILKAFGENEQGEASGRMFAYRAGLARTNATINRQNADWATEAGAVNAERSGLTTRFTIGKQKVAQAANGFDVNSGTNAEVRDATDTVGLQDQNTIRLEAGRKATGFRNAANSNEAEAVGDDMAGENARRAGRISALSTLIGTAGSVASRWTQSSQVFGSGGNISLYGPQQNFQGYYNG